MLDKLRLLGADVVVPDRDVHRSVGRCSAVYSFHVVPEPSSLALAGLGAAALAVVARHRRRAAA